MPIKHTRVVMVRGGGEKRVKTATPSKYIKSVSKSAGALLDPTGRAASASYSTRKETRPSAAESIAKDWIRVGQTLSKAFSQTPKPHVASKQDNR